MLLLLLAGGVEGEVFLNIGNVDGGFLEPVDMLSASPAGMLEPVEMLSAQADFMYEPKEML